MFYLADLPCLSYIYRQIKEDLTNLSIATRANQRSRATWKQQAIDVFKKLKISGINISFIPS